MTKHGWNFDNSYRRLPQFFYSEQTPAKVSSPTLVMFNERLANQLGLHAESLHSDEGAEIFSGNRLPDGAEPIAQAYAGHQFGYFTMLGDGRAILLGEQITPDGKRFDIQLKGAGRTRYSRRGDGRAALGPMLREYLISEAMHALGIPTTRSLAVVVTGEPVYRETVLPGAVLTRVASSHLRVGTFEYAAQWGNGDDLKQLADYAIKRHDPDIINHDERYLSFLYRVIERQARLIAKWQLVGFVHGVMNTDNMTISGETIDYGPCAFMDMYDPATVFSSIDRNGRYRYGNQPGIGQWNLTRFAETLIPLLHEEQDQAIELAKKALAHYADEYYRFWLNGMRAKLGLFEENSQDENLIKTLLDLMEKYHADYTNTFKALTFERFDDMELFESAEFREWHNEWQKRLQQEQKSASDVQELMKKHNPAVIPRNHRVEEALEAAVEKEDYSLFNQLLNVLSDPYAHTAEQEEYATLPEPSHYPYITYCGT